MEIKDFFENKDIYEKIKELNIVKEEIQNLKKELGDLSSPIIITISGTPRAGKTTCIDNLFDFFKKADFKTICVSEPAGLIYQTLKNKEEKKELLKDRVGFVDRQFELGNKLITENINNNELIICDRGVIDTFIWYNMYYKDALMDKDRYNKFMNNLVNLKDYENYFYALYTNSYESMRRDYISSLCLDKRTTMNEEYIEKYNASMEEVIPLIHQYINNCNLIDTTTMDRMGASIRVAEDILVKIKKKYIKGGRNVV